MHNLPKFFSVKSYLRQPETFSIVKIILFKPMVKVRVKLRVKARFPEIFALAKM